MEHAVRRRVALEREDSMSWFDHNSYLALVDKLAAAGNPEACFVLGVRLIFTQGHTDPVGIACLRQAADADHLVAAYVLGVLHYGHEEAEQYIRQVEGEGDVVAHTCKPEASKTNRECVKCREQAVDVVREVIWRVDRMMDPMPVPPAAVNCKGSGCGVAEGWTRDYTVFCSDGCRIRHEYSEFFSRVSSFHS
jgi:TPR repeat protein